MREHISGQYDAELDALRARVMEMGGLVELQLRRACDALFGHDSTLAERVIADDADVNRLEIALDDDCNHVIARRHPAASDLRLVMTIVKTITDLERSGDEASRIAKAAAALTEMERPHAEAYPALRQLAQNVRDMLRVCLDAYARVDVETAMDVIARDKSIDTGYEAIVADIIPLMEQQPSSSRRLLNVIWCARSLERIGDHAKNICEYVVYLSRGQDVRHRSLPRAGNMRSADEDNP